MNNAIEVSGVEHFYGKNHALRGVDLEIKAGRDCVFIGADGVGKSTLLSLIAGSRILQHGEIRVLGLNPRKTRDRDELSRRVAFMPQGLGFNLYPTLSIDENLDFHARLLATPRHIRNELMDKLLTATGLIGFRSRAAGKLSGGMKQKLGLCCALLRRPEILILDEPTTGVDPLSRRQFWSLIQDLRTQLPNMTVLTATAYIDEAVNFSDIAIFDAGKILHSGEISKLIADDLAECSSSVTALERVYNRYLPENKRSIAIVKSPFISVSSEKPVITAESLLKKFGQFTAVNNVSFSIKRGEIFGFLGSNGCGKSTTMKMLTGLLEPDGGKIEILSTPEIGSMLAKKSVGYMSQNFSLYEEISLRENLQLHATLYGIDRQTAKSLINQALNQYQLADFADTLPKNLPLGMRQRLQLAAACLHNPQILILDEPTSGVDPAARDLFWVELLRLSREKKITIFVSTHFMNEAARCDRISFMHRGKVLDIGSPDELVEKQKVSNLEEAFIKYLEIEEKEFNSKNKNTERVEKKNQESIKKSNKSYFEFLLPSFIRLIFAFARRELIELFRDPIRIFFAIFGPLLIIITGAMAISFDIKSIPFVVEDFDNSDISRKLIAEYENSPYFKRIYPNDNNPVEELLKAGKVKFILDISPNFSNDVISRNNQAQLGIIIDGSMPFMGENVLALSQAAANSYLQKIYASEGKNIEQRVQIEPRYAYNPDFQSVYAMTPGMITLSLVLVPVMMTALGVARERELGSIVNWYCSPASALQYLLGKQIPYFCFAFASFLILVFVAIVLYSVPMRGSFLALECGAILLILAVTGFGLFISALIRSQIAAMIFAAMASVIPAMSFSGIIFPISALTGGGAFAAKILPAPQFQKIVLGCFTKGYQFSDFYLEYLILLTNYFFYLFLASILLKKQEK
ncbi:MAG: ribosome-associated ATPase/putative transporter RbbA [Cardiobacteriaceae bacterium]|nr:ribosome-associated ATPase/putative transporter RbbA [Cardiobacteriaceae bacterium]